ncbi:unnamed protein product [Periconia digitata]|uniref:Calcineurin-like phosphoesterase domain-containing protein n=1 Tax=Periconia digitata TaxID=1303443 RepID=A0A9W4UR04_9PLEO|nr:unnamed protein product [Periconia digitata]
MTTPFQALRPRLPQHEDHEETTQFPSSPHDAPISTSKLAYKSFTALTTPRKLILLISFLLGISLTTMLKHESLLWLLASKTGTTPMVGYGQGAPFDYPGLRFDVQDRKFQITVFSDLHLADQARPEGSDNQTIAVMNKVLDAEPGTDLVVLNGDLISCEWVGPESVNSTIDKIIDPLLARKLPFTATFGNHDMSKTCDTRAVAQHMREKASVLATGHREVTWTRNAVQGKYEDVGTSNYYIPVYSASGGGNPNLSMVLWFFDSRGGNKYQPGGEDEGVGDWVGDEVVSWFTLQRNFLLSQNNNIPIPSLAFVHIPPSVTAAFQKSGLRTEATEPGLNEETINTQAEGIKGGDHKFLQALIDTEGLMAVFSGHDHRIDWCMKYSRTHPIPTFQPPVAKNGMHLCFNRHTGYGGYSDYERGGRHIVVDEDDLITSLHASHPRQQPPGETQQRKEKEGGGGGLQMWIRLESGHVSGNVSLNASYGVDEYEVVGRGKTFLGGGGVEVDLSSSSSLAPSPSYISSSAGYASRVSRSRSSTPTPPTTTTTTTTTTSATGTPESTPIPTEVHDASGVVAVSRSLPSANSASSPLSSSLLVMRWWILVFL